MKLTTKQKIWTIVLIVVIIALILFLVKFFQKNKGETCPDGTVIPPSGNCSTVVKTDSKGNVIPPKADSNGCFKPSSYSAASFPIGLGMSGNLVKQIQAYVGVKQDGYFGCVTQGAVQKKLGANTVDQTTFNNITTSASASTTNAAYDGCNADGTSADGTGLSTAGFDCKFSPNYTG